MYGYWNTAGIDFREGNALDSEIEELATRLVKGGVTPLGPWNGMGRWVDMKLAQIYPDPGVLPPVPREPSVNTMAMAFLAAPLIAVSTIVFMSAAWKGGVMTAGIIFWVGYICLWIAAGIWSRSHDESVRRYWATYDPHHRDRPNLRRELESGLKSAIDHVWHEFHRPVATIPSAQVAAQPRAALPWNPAGDRPSPLSACTEREAEFLAMRWMQFLGVNGCRVSAASRDGGADVISEDFVAEVKHHAAAVSPAYVRQIFGVATAEGKKALFFSLSGYSDASIQFGEQTGVALFAYNYVEGTLLPKSTAARKALEQGLPSLKNR